MLLPGHAFTCLHAFDVPLPGASVAKTVPPSDQKDIVITQLINNLAKDPDTKTLWDKFLDNDFCKQGYTTEGKDFNPKYQAYSKQDYLYLVEYVRFVIYRSMHGPPGALTRDNLKNIADDMTKKVEKHVDAFAKDCKAMGIKDLEKERFWTQVLGYTSWEQLVVMSDDLFSDYIRMIPCLYGWNKIALKLRDDHMLHPQKDAYFYKYWFSANIPEHSANKISQYLDDHVSKCATDDDWKKWTETFRQACLFEMAFFDAALVVKIPVNTI